MSQPHFAYNKFDASLEMAEVRYLRKIYFCLLVLLAVSITTMVLFIVLLAGGLKTTTIMNRMDSQMSEMTGQMKQVGETGASLALQLKDKFPANQPEISLKQVLGIISNGQQISNHLNELIGKVDEGSVKHTTELIKSIRPDDINNVISSVTTLVKNIDAEKINNVLTAVGTVKIDALNTLLKRITEIHKAEINF